MTAAIHQPLYFPWIGYLDKMAKVDKFIFLDSVAMTKPSPITRNRFLTENGVDKYLTIGIISKNHLNLKISDVKLNPMDSLNSLEKHKNFLKFNYRKSPYFNEIWESVESLLNYSGDSLLNLLITTIDYLRNVFAIKTDLILQSKIGFNEELKNNELLISLLKSINTHTYLSGVGAKGYMNDKLFKDAMIDVCYQKYDPIVYKQFNTPDFIPNLSSLDLLFNCGLEESKRLFWRNVERKENQKDML